MLCCGLSGEGVDPFPGEQDKVVPHASVQALHGGLIYPGERGKGKETEGIQVRERSKNVRNDTILRCVSPFKSLWKIELKDKFTLVQKSLKSMHFFYMTCFHKLFEIFVITEGKYIQQRFRMQEQYPPKTI